MNNQIKKHINVVIVAPFHPERSYQTGGGQAKFIRYFMDSTMEGINIYNVSNTNLFKKRQHNIKYGRYLKPIRSIIIFSKTIFYCLFYNINIVHIFSPTNRLGFYEKLILAVMIRMTRTKTIFNFRGDISVTSIYWKKIEKFIIKYFLPFNTLILSQSEKLSNYLKTNYLVHEQKLAFIPNGIDVYEYTGKIYDKNKVNGNINILFIGSICYRKGVDLIIKAVSYLKNIHKSQNINISIYGYSRSTEAIKGFYNDIKLYGIEEFIKLQGPLHGKEKQNVLSKADIFVLPSRSEGFPNAVLEAMLVGIPVVVSNVGALPEIIKNGYNGLLFENENYTEFAEKMNYLLNNAEDRKRMGQAARETVLEKYNIDQILDQFRSLYIKLAN